MAEVSSIHQENIEQKYLEFHKKKSQPTNAIVMKKEYLMLNYEMSALSENEAEESVIVSSISNSIRSNGHILMDKSTSCAARNYYQRIVNNQYTTYDQKKLKIYLDLVVASEAVLGKKRERERDSEVLLNYKIGKETENICSVSGCALTVGRYKETDICIGYKDLTISRIQCFILIIDDYLIILDGWSYFGTKIIQVNGEKNNLQHSMPNKRFVLRFNKNDTIHLRFGETNVDLIINPKKCLVCMDKSRTIRNECGHLILCCCCYNNILATTKSKSVCPICRAPMRPNLHNNISNGVNLEDDMIKSYCKPTHL